ncbi:TPA: hypothetical protein ACWX1I_002014 [Elizabethkingia anophelis]
MGINSTNLKIILLISIFGIVAIIVLFKIFSYFLNKFFLDHFTFVMQRTIMRSYRVFKTTVILVILAYLLTSLYCIFFAGYRNYGIILLFLTLYLIFTIYNDKKNGKLRLKETFDFQKHSTPVSFYNKQSESYRRISYKSVINRIEISDFVSIKENELRLFLKVNFLQKIENLLTFEYYDAKLYHSISNHQTGILFYSKFLKNVLEIISRIDKQTNSLKALNGNYDHLADILLNIKLIKFDDNQGLHYDIALVDLELDKILNVQGDSSIEKSLCVIGNSIQDLKLALNNTAISLQSDQDTIFNDLMQKLDEMETVIQKGKEYKVIILPERCTAKDVEEIFLDSFKRKSQLELLPKNVKDIESFITKRFRNNANKQRSRKNYSYSDSLFFIENRESFYKAASLVCSKFSIEKKLLAEIIIDEFPNIGHGLNTIKNRL